MMRPFAARLYACSRGVLAIESVLVAPVLVLMALGAFQMGQVVSRQQELQSGASEVVAIILAANASSSAISSDDIKAVVKTSLNLADNEVTLTRKYRCGTATTLTETANSCATGVQQYEYVVVALTDTITPTWAKYGMGSAFNFSVNRTVQIK